jgi:prefoldin subunit 4
VSISVVLRPEHRTARYGRALRRSRYKVGDCFVSLPQPEVLELLSASQESIDEEVTGLRENLDGIHEQMDVLKKALYGRFGRSINLET